MSALLREDTVQKKKNGRHDAGEQTSTAEREGPRAPGRNYDSRSRESGRAASGQQARICRALRFQFSRVMLA